jgi:N-acyl-D-amino-acid deacylase
MLSRLFIACGLLLCFQLCSEDSIPVTGREVPELKPFDDLFKTFLAEHQIPGAGVAITRYGRVIYSRGFGYADPETKRSVQPGSLFRIASISKPITAVAVLKLAEAGKFKLDDKVLALLGLTPTEKGDARLKDITVRELLQHSGGWDRDKSYDPMFHTREICKTLNIEAPVTSARVIQYMLGQKLDFEPGTSYAYSNFGYCLLGRLIEKASGQSYEAYVREQVLKPLEIRHMQLGKSALENALSGEVYYCTPKGGEGNSVLLGGPKKVPIPYGTFDLEAMDAHGGWVASAEDLAKFCAAFDDLELCKILNGESARTMFERPAGILGNTEDGKPKAAFYACGWLVRPVGVKGKFNAWHNGSLPGTSTLMVRRFDGLCWSVLFNSRATAGKDESAGLIDELMHKAAQAVVKWPE